MTQAVVNIWICYITNWKFIIMIALCEISVMFNFFKQLFCMSMMLSVFDVRFIDI